MHPMATDHVTRGSATSREGEDGVREGGRGDDRQVTWRGGTLGYFYDDVAIAP